MIKLYRFRPLGLVLFCGLLFFFTTSTTQASQKLLVSYQYPVRSAKNVLPTTGIGIRISQQVDVRDITSGSIRVTGSKSGVIDGKIIVADDKQTVIFTPKSEFQLGEKVTVEVGGSLPVASFDFTITTLSPTASRKSTEEESYFDRSPFLQIPMADTPAPPTFTVHSSNAPADGYMFLSTNRPAPNTDTYIVAVDNSGTIQWKQYGLTQQPNFAPQRDGKYSYLRQSAVAADAAFIILDSNFQEIGQIKATDGNTTKIHELLLLPNGHMMLLGRYARVVDMTTVVTGGQPYASVEETVIQEFDSSGNVVFQWRTEDHYNVTDGTHEDYTLQNINYSFINALSIDNDGQLLASARRMDEITKIDRATGNIIWRLGGKHNQFTLIGDTTWFSHAHNIQALPNGHYIMFDNGLYNTPKVSRALEYVVDTAAKTVTQVWGFAHPDSIAGDMQGSVTRLPNGNTLIGWGINTTRTYTEATPDKQIALDVTMAMNGPSSSYRVYKAVRNLPKASVKKEIAANVLGLTAFPNPTSGLTTLSYTIGNASDVTYSIIDALGRQVRNGNFGVVSKGTSTSSISLSGLAKGVYTVQVYADGKTSASRLVVE